jgi:hypothetical protein
MAMAAKEKRTGAELTAIIMQEVRQHSDCNDITNVAIIRPVQYAPDGLNWGFAWTRDYTSNLAPAMADEIARKLRNQFDLA